MRLPKISDPVPDDLMRCPFCNIDYNVMKQPNGQCPSCKTRFGPPTYTDEDWKRDHENEQSGVHR